MALLCKTHNTAFSVVGNQFFTSSVQQSYSKLQRWRRDANLCAVSAAEWSGADFMQLHANMAIMCWLWDNISMILLRVFLCLHFTMGDSGLWRHTITSGNFIHSNKAHYYIRCIHIQ